MQLLLVMHRSSNAAKLRQQVTDVLPCEKLPIFVKFMLAMRAYLFIMIETVVAVLMLK